MTRTLSIIGSLAAADLKQRYSGSLLGIVWVLLKPLLLFAVLYLVFSRVFAANDPLYALKLLTGFVLWNFFAEASMLAMTSLVNQAFILTRIRIRLWSVIAAAILSSSVNFAANLVILLIFCATFHRFPDAAGLLILLTAAAGVALIAFIVGLATAPLFVRFRDLNQVWEVVLQAGFFLTPIIYPFELIPQQLKSYAVFNPFAYLIEFARAGVIGTEFPFWPQLFQSLVPCAAMAIVAVAGFRIARRGVVERL